MQLPQSTDIEIAHLNHLFDKTSECYKFFWFQAMLTKISQGYDTFSYQVIWEYEKVHTMFLNCAKDHLNNDHIRMKLYRQGLGYDEFQGILYDVVSPVYRAARDCGFTNWILKK